MLQYFMDRPHLGLNRPNSTFRTAVPRAATRAIVSAVLTPILLFGSGDKQETQPDPGRGVNFYSLEKEIALGKQLAQEVERQAKVVDDSIISEYVNRLGQNLVHSSDAKVPFTIKVIDSPDVNAFALPGGFMFVNSGLV